MNDVYILLLALFCGIVVGTLVALFQAYWKRRVLRKLAARIRLGLDTPDRKWFNLKR